MSNERTVLETKNHETRIIRHSQRLSHHLLISKWALLHVRCQARVCISRNKYKVFLIKQKERFSVWNKLYRCMIILYWCDYKMIQAFQRPIKQYIPKIINMFVS